MTVSTEKQTDSSVFPRTFHEAHETTCQWWPEFWRRSKAPCNSGGRSPEPSIRLSLSSGGDGERGGGKQIRSCTGFVDSFTNYLNKRLSHKRGSIRVGHLAG